MKNKEEVKLEILCAAERLFERYGYDKTTIEEISAESNKAKTAVYYYFKSKSEIFNKVLDKEFAYVRQRLEEVRNGRYANKLSELRDYLKIRMELVRSTRIYSRYLTVKGLKTQGEAYSIISDIRKEFDRWEVEYFEMICQKGVESGFLSDRVKPETFGEMLEMLLKGIEIQFVNSENPASSKNTYEEILDRLILGCTIQANK